MNSTCCMLRRWTVVVAALLLLSLLPACAETRLQEETQTVELGDAGSVRAEIRMGAGELRISGGAADLLNGEFVYNIESWRPLISYDVSQDRGLLRVEQRASTNLNLRNVRYEWDLHLNDDVPLDLDVELGAGEARLELGSLSLNSFDLSTGAGEVTVDLTGDWENDLNANITGGVGQLTLRLPRDTGVRVQIAGGLGDVDADALSREDDAYVNDAYGQSESTLYVDVEGGVGQIYLELGE